MNELILDEFKTYFPSLSRKMVKFKRLNVRELLVKLDDGSGVVFDMFEHSIRWLPSDSENMTEQQCRKEFGLRLRKIMEIKGMTQDDLANKTGINRVILSNYIRGKNTPSFYRIDKIAKALGCSADDFRYID